MKHQIDHAQQNHALAVGRLLLIVLAQTTVTTKPTKRPLHHPTPRQNHKALEIIAALDYLQRPAENDLYPFHQFAPIAAISPDQLQTRKAVAQTLHYQFCPVTILNVGRVNKYRQDQSHRVDDYMTLAPIDFLARIVTAQPTFSVVFTLWLSITAALGVLLRPAFFRTLSRSASWIRCQIPQRQNLR